MAIHIRGKELSQECHVQCNQCAAKGVWVASLVAVTRKWHYDVSHLGLSPQ